MIVWKGKLYFNREDANLPKKEGKYVQKRYQAVAFCLQPVSPMTRREAAERHGVSKRTIKRWIKRYCTAGIPGLRKNSTRPHKIKGKVTPQGRGSNRRAPQENRSRSPENLVAA